MKALTRKFGSSFSLTENEKCGLKIEKNDADGALLGFHYSLMAEVFSNKAMNENGFINQFTSLWRENEGVSIRALGGNRFMARFVGRKDMSRVLDADKPWLFRDDLALLADGARHGCWAEALSIVTMWVQLHNVPSMNMTEAVAVPIRGLIGRVITMDKDDGRDCIGRFLRVKIDFDV